MDRIEIIKKRYVERYGYVCFFCKVKCTRDGKHNRSLEHLENMAKGLNVPMELIIPTNSFSRRCLIKNSINKLKLNLLKK
jgi:hypothetical protein